MVCFEVPVWIYLWSLCIEVLSVWLKHFAAEVLLTACFLQVKLSGVTWDRRYKSHWGRDLMYRRFFPASFSSDFSGFAFLIQRSNSWLANNSVLIYAAYSDKRRGLYPADGFILVVASFRSTSAAVMIHTLAKREHFSWNSNNGDFYRSHEFMCSFILLKSRCEPFPLFSFKSKVINMQVGSSTKPLKWPVKCEPGMFII